MLLATKDFFLAFTWTWENTAYRTVSLECVDACVEQLYLALDSLPTWCPAPSLVSQPQNVLVLWLSLPPRQPALHTHSLSCWSFLGVLGCLAVSPGHFVAISQQPLDDCSPEHHVHVCWVQQLSHRWILYFSCPVKFKLQEGVKLSLSSVLFGIAESCALVIGKIKEIESKKNCIRKGRL